MHRQEFFKIFFIAKKLAYTCKEKVSPRDLKQ